MRTSPKVRRGEGARHGTRVVRVLVLAAVAALVTVLAPALQAPASAHGWVTSPPSRQDNCSTGATSFDCGPVSYEPQSVEATKGSTLCSGGSAYTVLDDDALPWPVTDVGSSLTLRWNLTAAHRTSTWDYFVDGQLVRTVDQGDTQPPSQVEHTLDGLPQGRHTILARWNVADTPMAFYSCVDVNVGGGGGEEPEPEPGCDAAAWASGTAYTGGQVVRHDGRLWTARWWTQGETPGTAEVWTDSGACTAAAPGAAGRAAPVPV